MPRLASPCPALWCDLSYGSAKRLIRHRARLRHSLDGLKRRPFLSSLSCYEMEELYARRLSPQTPVSKDSGVDNRPTKYG